MSSKSPSGVGLGLRLAMAEQMLDAPQGVFDFVEVAPENYMDTGGYRERILAMAKERWPLVSHGLCGDLAASAPLNANYVDEIGRFLRSANAKWYSDHLCFTQLAGAETHDLIPLPFTTPFVRRVAKRVQELQDRLDLPVAIENISAYARYESAEMSETDFIAAVVNEAGCGLLLDVNNVYVNSVNFAFDPYQFIDALPLDRVFQIHVAGFEQEAPNLLIDTHGAPIADPVYDLLSYTLGKMKKIPPVLLERDNNIPAFAELLTELSRLKEIVSTYAQRD